MRFSRSRTLRPRILDLNPNSDSWLGLIDAANYRQRHFRRACEKAGLGARQSRDLRGTFANRLLADGIQLGYVSGVAHLASAAFGAVYFLLAGAPQLRLRLLPRSVDAARPYGTRLPVGGSSAPQA
jgi:hypothetical protein